MKSDTYLSRSLACFLPPSAGGLDRLFGQLVRHELKNRKLANIRVCSIDTCDFAPAKCVIISTVRGDTTNLKFYEPSTNTTAETTTEDN